MTNELVLIRGLPGSGKSTYAKDAFPNHKLVEADQFFEVDGTRFYRDHLLYSAHSWCQARTDLLLSCRCDVVVANTFVNLKHIAPYVSLAVKYYVPITVLTMRTQYETDSVPPKVMENMKKYWEELTLTFFKDWRNIEVDLQDVVEDLV